MHDKLSEVHNNFARQAEYCEKLGSPFYARLLPEVSELIQESEFMTQVLSEWQGDPHADAIALRFAAALNFLVLTEQAETLKEFFPPSGSPLSIGCKSALEECIEKHRNFIVDYIQSPPQTNEVGRCMVLLGGFLEVAQRFGADMDIFEIGSSAGLNLFFDGYYYQAKDWSRGNSDATLKFNLDWRGPSPPLTAIRVINRKACDRSPIDLERDKNRLLSYVWPDQVQRLTRLRAAIEQVSLNNLSGDLSIEESDAGAWLKKEAKAVLPSRVRVIYHSIVLQYFSADERYEFLNTIEAMGSKATINSPLAWLRLEPAPNKSNAELRLTTWPDKRECRLAISSFHGDWVDWFGVNSENPGAGV